MKKLVIALVAVGILGFGCGNPQVIQTLQQESVGQVPCNADHVEVIQHIIRDDGSATWTALCSGHTYNCQRPSENAEAICSQMESQMPE